MGNFPQPLKGKALQQLGSQYSLDYRGTPMISKGVEGMFIISLLVVATFVVFPTNGAEPAGDSPQTHGIMHYSPQTLHELMDSLSKAPLASIDPNIVVPASAHFDLMSHLQYTPAQRDQGSAGNCWVWGGTGVMEVALDVQEGIKDRLSIQYFDSNYNGGTGVGSGCSWAGCGGNLNWFAQFYSGYRGGSKQAIPWSNTNAAYQDTYQSCPVDCESSGTAVPAASISTTPNYPIQSVTENAIPYTHEVSQDTVTASIKNILHQNKAIYFAFTLPNGDAWDDFYSWWWYQPQSASYDMDKYNLETYDYDTGGGHAVLLVGYDDTNPADRYWIMVNSWGTTPEERRPNGIFHVKMDMNYRSVLDDPYDGSFYNLWWETLDVNFSSLGTQLAYDDGSSEGSSAMTTPGYYMAVKFSLPDGWPSANVLNARYYLWSAVSFKVHVFGSDGTTDLVAPLVVDPGSGYEGWFRVDLTSYQIVVSGDFYVAIEYTAGYYPMIGDDSNAPDGRSYYGQPGGWVRFGDSPPPPALDLMIRADVDHDPMSFDFRLYNSGSSSNLGGVSVARGGSGSITVTVTLEKSPAQIVALSCAGTARGDPLPSDVICSFGPGSGSPPFTSTLTIYTSSSTPTGYYTIKVTGTAGSLTRQTLFILLVT
jgi:hypothetical protein